MKFSFKTIALGFGSTVVMFYLFPPMIATIIMLFGGIFYSAFGLIIDFARENETTDYFDNEEYIDTSTMSKKMWEEYDRFDQALQDEEGMDIKFY